MADWKRLAKALALTDGYIERKETDTIKKEFIADGVISKSEAEFLIDLRRSAKRAVDEFHQFVFEVVKKAVLADGMLTPTETTWIEKFILTDGKIDEMERAFLTDLKASAESVCPEFEALVRKHAGG